MGERAIIVGDGGREHAMMNEIGRSSAASAVSMLSYDDSPETTARLLDAIDHAKPDLVVVGPEAPLIAGLADLLDQAGFGDKTLGIRQETSFLEGSKCDADAFMEAFHILRPPATTVHTWYNALSATHARDPRSYVIKADGIAGGKGVILPGSLEQSLSTMQDMLSGESFNGAGRRLQVQERWHGPEVSVFAVSDGERYYIVPFFSQDHKRLLDGDQGPNTGGMGAYAPYLNLTDRQYDKIYESIDKTYYGLQQRGLNAKGILYFSFMMAEEAGEIPGHEAGDPAMIEYNIRFGDPEAQVVLPCLTRAGVDVYDLFKSAAAGNLRPDDYDVSAEKILGTAALSVCLAAEGYPGTPQKEKIINNTRREYLDVDLHYAGVGYSGEHRITNGGRVMYVTGYGNNVDAAAHAAYAAIGKDNDGVYFSGMQYRTDIGYQARSAA